MILTAAFLAEAIVLSAPIDPISAFKAVCMSGEAHFTNGSIKPVQFKTLPAEIRQYYRPNDQSTLFIGEGINGPVILAVEYRERPDGSKHCEVFSPDLNENRLKELDFDVRPPTPSPKATRNYNSSYELISNYGYSLKAIKAGSRGMIIRSISMTAAQSESRQADYKTAQDPTVSGKERRAAARRIAEKGNQ